MTAKRKRRRKHGPAVEYEPHCFDCCAYEGFASRRDAEEWLRVRHADCAVRVLYSFRELAFG